MRNTKTKNSKRILTVITNYFIENIKSYTFVAIIFAIGIALAIVFINNLEETQRNEISTYITTFTNSLKDGYTINKATLFTSSAWKNIILCIIMWFAGSTVIGIPIVLGIVAYRGFCIGYTVLALTFTYGTGSGTIFFLTSMLLQNIVIIPCILSLAVSGLKLYKSIIKDRRRENVKIEIVRHTIFSILVLIMLIIASLIETYISTSLLQTVIGLFQ